EEVRGQERELVAEVERLAGVLTETEQARREAEAAHQEEQQRLARLARAAAERREGLARLTGQVAARRSRLEAGEAELERLRANAAGITTRARTTEQEFAALEAT